MWIHHIGEIAMGFFVLLIVLHFSLHIIFKIKRSRLDKAERALEQQEEKVQETKQS